MTIKANQTTDYVFQLPVRIWHGAHALSFLTLAVTGYLIAHPLPSVTFEASGHFVMGNIRLIHFCAAYVFTIGFLLRIYWAFVGNRFAREIFYLPVWDRQWRKKLWREIRYYSFLEEPTKEHEGHNALARVIMNLFHVLGSVLMIGTGFALYAEGTGAGSWPDAGFGWIIPLMGGSESVHNWHNLGMWIFAAAVLGHIYAAFREELLSRQTHLSAIVSGYRVYKDELP